MIKVRLDRLSSSTTRCEEVASAGGRSHLGLIPSTLRDGTAWSRLFPTKIQAYEARLDACILVVLKLELIGYY